MEGYNRKRGHNSRSYRPEDEIESPDRDEPHRKKRKYVIGYKRLKELSKASPRDAAVQCSQANFLSLLSDEQVASKRDWIDLILVSIDLSLKADHSMSDIKSRLVRKLLSNHIRFLQQTCISRIEEALGESAGSSMDNSLVTSLRCYLQIYHKLCSMDSLARGNLLRSVELVLFKLKEVKSEKVTELLADYSSAVQSAKANERLKREQTNAGRGDRVCTTDRPTDDFRLLKPYPTVEDINSFTKVQLRRNKDCGGFEDVDDYLDLQYRLLREDFVSTIRDGVRTVRKKSGLARQGLLKSGGDFKVYNNFWIEGLDISRNGLCYSLRVDVEHAAFNTSQWLKSKRLKFGSLICLSTSSNCFRNEVLFATIVERAKPEGKGNQTQGVNEWKTIKIMFLSESLQTYTAMNFTEGPFMVIESSAFFEAYTHVLKGLIKFDEFKLPMQKYIVRCEKEMEQPEYLRDLDLYYRLPADTLLHKELLRVTDLTKWPSAAQLMLNQSQYKAFQLALTQEFCVIQEPPGTGKTYVGLRIVQTLLGNLYNIGPCSDRRKKRRTPSMAETSSGPKLANMVTSTTTEDGPKPLVRKLRSIGGVLSSGHRPPFPGYSRSPSAIPSHGGGPAGPVEDKKAPTEDFRPLQPDLMTVPILVVCYTNHALDQFLEGILDFCDKPGEIIRVGGRCKSERLQAHNIHKAKQSAAGSNCRLYDQRDMKSDIIKKCTKMKGMLEVAQSGSFNFPVSEFVTEDEFRGRFATWKPWLFGGSREEAQWENDRFQSWRCLRMSYTNTAAAKESQQMADVHLAQESSAVEVEQVEEYDEEEDKLEGVDTHEEASKLLHLNISEIQETKDIVDNSMMSEEEVDYLRVNGTDLCSLSLHCRWKLFRYWYHMYELRSQRTLLAYQKELGHCLAMEQNLSQQRDIDVLKRAKVIGMTTTAAARLQSVLQSVGPEIVVVEEAAEVLEAHIITALSSHCKHLILIGDHKQLKPNPAVYELAKRYHLDLSLFERMVNNGLPVSTLDIQHRMRPEISKYIRGHIYENLQDHKSVLDREPIRGVLKSVLFFNHCNPESEVVGLMSKRNEFEADMIVKFARYLTQRGYGSKQLTVITMYKGQEMFIKNKIRGQNEFENMRVSSVDNFQGEENDIIFISLVRSNTEKKLGFIDIENRVCVTMSRAKLGMYVFGNFGMIANQSEIWAKMITEAKAAGEYGTEINLSCAHHQKAATVSTPEEFDIKAPQGGCTELCNAVLDCGHICTWKCHYDGHSQFVCQEKCARTCPSGHQCKGICRDPCDPCEELVTKVLTSCSHDCTAPCHKWNGFSQPECKVKCSKLFDCGHTCQRDCSKPCGPCREEIEKLCSRCGEIQKVPCSSKFQCKTPCKGQLDCGHVCTGTCFSCSAKEETAHKPCTEVCNKHLPCGHKCKDACHVCTWRGRCAPECYEKCLLKCSHGTQCSERCNEVCKFEEKLSRCQWGCQRHTTKCTTRCGQSCTFTKCDRSCRRDVKCLICNRRRQCRGMCGQHCPLLCNKCKLPKIEKEVRKLSAPVCTIGRETKWLLLEDCTHSIPVDYMDRWVDVHKHKLPILCPFDNCKKPVLNTARYVGITRGCKWILDEERRPYQTKSSQRSSSKGSSKSVRDRNRDRSSESYSSSDDSRGEGSTINGNSLPMVHHSRGGNHDRKTESVCHRSHRDSREVGGLRGSEGWSSGQLGAYGGSHASDVSNSWGQGYRGRGRGGRRTKPYDRGNRGRGKARGYATRGPRSWLEHDDRVGGQEVPGTSRSSQSAVHRSAAEYQHRYQTAGETDHKPYYIMSHLTNRF